MNFQRSLFWEISFVEVWSQDSAITSKKPSKKRSFFKVNNLFVSLNLEVFFFVEYLIEKCSEAYLEPQQTSEPEHFTKTGNAFKG